MFILEGNPQNPYNLHIFVFLLSRLHNIFWKHTNSIFLSMHKNCIADFKNSLVFYDSKML